MKSFKRMWGVLLAFGLINSMQTNCYFSNPAIDANFLWSLVVVPTATLSGLCSLSSLAHYVVNKYQIAKNEDVSGSFDSIKKSLEKLNQNSSKDDIESIKTEWQVFIKGLKEAPNNSLWIKAVQKIFCIQNDGSKGEVDTDLSSFWNAVEETYDDKSLVSLRQERIRVLTQMIHKVVAKHKETTTQLQKAQNTHLKKSRVWAAVSAGLMGMLYFGIPKITTYFSREKPQPSECKI